MFKIALLKHLEARLNKHETLLDNLRVHLNTVRYNIHQLQFRHAQLEDHIIKLDQKIDDALHDLKQAEDGCDVRG